MNPLPFTIIYFIGLILASTVRWHYTRDYRKEIRREGKRPPVDTPLVYLPVLGMFVFPAAYALSPLLSVADYSLFLWAGLTGAVIYAAAIWLMWRSHKDLGKNFSPVTEIRAAHNLVTDGVYSHIRHPIYAAHLLWGIAQPLLLWNWIAGFSMLATMIPLYLARVGPEEKMMIDEFGDEYKDYMKRTGRLVPKFLWDR